MCTQCTKASRADECQYYEKKRTSRTQLLQAKITKLEARLRELEAEQSPLESSSSSGSQSPEADRMSLTLSRTSTFLHVTTSGVGLNAACGRAHFISLLLESELGLPFDPTSAYSTPEADYLGNISEAFPHFDGGSFFPDFPDSGGLGGLPWSGDGLDVPPSLVDDLLAQCPNPSSSSLHESSPGPSLGWWENDVFCENKQMLYACVSYRSHKE